MIFHTFKSQKERSEFGGSSFIEIQFCKMNPETETGKLVEIDSINNWQDDSLYIYIDDIEKFQNEYSYIFRSGLYNNLERGAMDIYGINWYMPQMIDDMMARLCEDKPVKYETVIEWLNRAKCYNGFYILGI